jgi:hypothetical protein
MTPRTTAFVHLRLRRDRRATGGVPVGGGAARAPHPLRSPGPSPARCEPPATHPLRQTRTAPRHSPQYPGSKGLALPGRGHDRAVKTEPVSQATRSDLRRTQLPGAPERGPRGPCSTDPLRATALGESQRPAGRLSLPEIAACGPEKRPPVQSAPRGSASRGRRGRYSECQGQRRGSWYGVLRSVSRSPHRPKPTTP